MTEARDYTDLRGETISLSDLDDGERKLLARLRRRAKSHPDWNDFENYWIKTVGEFYEARGMTRKQSMRTPLYRVAQDLCSRLGIAQGSMRAPDYRDELAELIRRRFETRREFCEASGISEDMLSHVLARRKHLSIETLTAALARIGCALRIMPLEPVGSEK